MASVESGAIMQPVPRPMSIRGAVRVRAWAPGVARRMAAVRPVPKERRPARRTRRPPIRSLRRPAYGETSRETSGEGASARPHVDRAEAELLLEEEAQREDRADQGGADRTHQGGHDGEAAVGEQGEGDEGFGVLTAGLVAEEQGAEGQGRGGQGPDPGVPGVAVAFHQGEGEAGQGGAGEQDAGDIEAVGAAGTQVGYPAEGQREDQQADGDVDEEHPAPADRTDDEPAEGGTGEGGHAA